MGRSITNTVEYFSHDVEHGKTLYILERKWKNDGYAVWFKLLEILGKTEGHYLDLRDEMNYEYFLAHMNTPEITVTEILDTLSKLGKIDTELWDNKIIWCQNFVDGLDRVYSKRGRKLPQKPSLDNVSDAEKELSAHAGTSSAEKEVTVAESTQSKVEYSKEEESRGESAGANPSPILAKRNSDPEEKDYSRINDVPLPEMFQTKAFYDQYRKYLKYMEENYQSIPTPTTTENDIGQLVRLKNQGNDPVAVIQQTMSARNKSFYPLKDKQFQSNTPTNGKSTEKDRKRNQKYDESAV